MATVSAAVAPRGAVRLSEAARPPLPLFPLFLPAEDCPRAPFCAPDADVAAAVR